MAALNVTKPSASTALSVPLQGGGEPIAFRFDASEANFERMEGDLVLSFEDGAQVKLEGFFARDENADLPTLQLEDGTQISAADFLKALNPEFDLSTAAGPAAGPSSSGSGSYADDAGSLLEGVDRLGSLGTTRWSGGRETVEYAAGTTSFGDGGPGTDPGPGIVDPEPVPPHHARLIITNAVDGSGFSFYAQDIEGNLIKDASLLHFSFPEGSSLYFDVSIDPVTGLITVTLTAAGTAALAAGEKFSDVLVVSVDGKDYVVDLLGNDSDSYDYQAREAETNFGEPLTGEWYASHGKLVFGENVTLGGIGYNQVDVVNRQQADSTALQDSRIAIADGKAGLVNVEAVSEAGNAYGVRTGAGNQSSVVAGVRGKTDSDVIVSATADQGSAYGIYAEGDTSVEATRISVSAKGAGHSAGIQTQNGAKTLLDAEESIAVSASSDNASASGVRTEGAGSETVLQAGDITVSASSVHDDANGAAAVSGGTNRLVGSDAGSGTITVSATTESGTARGMTGDSAILLSGDSNVANVSAFSRDGAATGLQGDARVTAGDGSGNNVSVAAVSVLADAYGLSEGASITLGKGDNNSVSIGARSEAGSAVGLDQKSSITLGDSATTGDPARANRADVQASSGAGGDAHGLYGASITAGKGAYDINVEASATGHGQISGMLGMKDAGISSAITIEEAHGSRVNVAASTDGTNWVSGMYGDTLIDLRSGSNTSVSVSATGTGSGDAFGMWSNDGHGTARITMGDGDASSVTVSATAHTGDAYAMARSEVTAGSGAATVVLNAASGQGVAYGAYESSVSMGTGGTLQVNAASKTGDAYGSKGSTLALGREDAADAPADQTLRVDVNAGGAAHGLTDTEVHMHGSRNRVDLAVNATAGEAVGMDGTHVGMRSEEKTGSNSVTIAAASKLGNATGMRGDSHLDLNGAANSVEVTVSAGGTGTGLEDSSIAMHNGPSAVTVSVTATGDATGLKNSRVSIENSTGGTINVAAQAKAGDAYGASGSNTLEAGDGDITVRAHATGGDAYGLSAHSAHGTAKNTLTVGGNVDLAATAWNYAAAMYADAGSANAANSVTAGGNVTAGATGWNATALYAGASQNGAIAENVITAGSGVTITATGEKSAIGISAQAWDGGDASIAILAGSDVTVTATGDAYATGLSANAHEDGSATISITGTGGDISVSASAENGDANGIFANQGGRVELRADQGSITVDSYGGTNVALGVFSQEDGSEVSLEARKNITVSARTDTALDDAEATAVHANRNGRVTLRSEEGDIFINAHTSSNGGYAHGTIGSAETLEIEALEGSISYDVNGHLSAAGLYGGGALRAGRDVTMTVNSAAGDATGMYVHGYGAASVSAGEKLDVSATGVSATGILAGNYSHVGATGHQVRVSTKAGEGDAQGIVLEENSFLELGANARLGEDPENDPDAPGSLTIRAESKGGTATGVKVGSESSANIWSTGDLLADVSAAGVASGLEADNATLSVNAEGDLTVKTASSGGSAAGVSLRNASLSMNGENVLLDVTAQGDAMGFAATDSYFGLGTNANLVINARSHAGAATGVSLKNSTGSMSGDALLVDVRAAGDATGVQLDETNLTADFKDTTIAASSSAGTATGLYLANGSGMGYVGANLDLTVAGATGATGILAEGEGSQLNWSAGGREEEPSFMNMTVTSSGGAATGIHAKGAILELSADKVALEVTAAGDATGVFMEGGGHMYLNGTDEASVTVTSTGGTAYGLRAADEDSALTFKGQTITVTGASSATALLVENGGRVGVTIEDAIRATAAGKAYGMRATGPNSHVDVHGDAAYTIAATSTGGDAYALSAAGAGSEISVFGSDTVTLEATAPGSAHGVRTETGARTEVTGKDVHITVDSANGSSWGVSAVGAGAEASVRATDGDVVITSTSHRESLGYHAHGVDGINGGSASVAGRNVTVSSVSDNNQSYGLYATGGGSVSVQAEEKVTIAAASSGFAYGIYAERGTVDVAGKNVEISAENTSEDTNMSARAIQALYTGAAVSIAADDAVSIAALGDANEAVGIYAYRGGVVDVNAQTITVSAVTDTAHAHAYGLRAESIDGEESRTTLTGNSVTVSAENSADSWAFAMHATGDGAVNEIIARSGQAFVATITASSANAAKAYAMWAAQGGAVNRIDGRGSSGADVTINGNINATGGGKNEILTSDGADTVTINGNVYGNNSLVDTGAGDDLIILNGAIAAGSLTIMAGDGHDTLILMAGSAHEFSSFYQSWLESLSSQEILDMSVETIVVHVTSGMSAADTAWLVSLLQAAGWTGSITDQDGNNLMDEAGLDMLAAAGHDNAFGFEDLLSDNETEALAQTDALTPPGLPHSSEAAGPPQAPSIPGQPDGQSAPGANAGVSHALDATPAGLGENDTVLYLEDGGFIALSPLLEKGEAAGVIDLQAGAGLSIDSYLEGLDGTPLLAHKLVVEEGSLNSKALAGSAVLRVHADAGDTVVIGNGWSDQAVATVNYEGQLYHVYQSTADAETQYLLTQIGLTVVD